MAWRIVKQMVMWIADRQVWGDWFLSRPSQPLVEGLRHGLRFLSLPRCAVHSGEPALS